MKNTLSKFSFHATLYYGTGAVYELPLSLKYVKISKPLLVTDRGIIETEVFSRIRGI